MINIFTLSLSHVVIVALSNWKPRSMGGIGHTRQASMLSSAQLSCVPSALIQWSRYPVQHRLTWPICSIPSTRKLNRNSHYDTNFRPIMVNHSLLLIIVLSVFSVPIALPPEFYYRLSLCPPSPFFQICNCVVAHSLNDCCFVIVHDREEKDEERQGEGG